MGSYPESITGKVLELPKRINQHELNKYGLSVVTGFTIDLANQLIHRSKEPHVVMNCENDAKSRFTSLKSIEEKWLPKKRLPLLLISYVEKDDMKRRKLEGFGWMGPEEPDEKVPQIPGAKITFAIRIYKDKIGQGFATPFTKVILDAHQAIIANNDGVWLEAYGDNLQAITPYERAGFEEVGRYSGTCHGEPRERVQMTLGKLAI